MTVLSTYKVRNSNFPTRLVVLLFREAELTINNTMWAALLTLLRNVESPKAGLLASWRTFLHAFSCSASTASLAKSRKHGMEN